MIKKINISESIALLIALLFPILLLINPIIIYDGIRESVVQSKYFTLSFSISAIFLVIILYYLIENPLYVKLHLIDCLVFVVILYIIIHSVFFNRKSFHYNQLIILLSLLITMPLVSRFIFSIYTKHKKNYIFYFIILVALIALFEATKALLQQWGIIFQRNTYFKITGSFINPAPFALLLAFAFNFCFWIVLELYESKKWIEKTAYIIALVSLLAILLIIPITLIRTSWIYVIISVLIILIYRYMFKIRAIWKNKLYKILIISIGSLFCLAVLCFLFLLKKDSSHSKMFIWKISASKFLETPIFGKGFGAFYEKYNLWQAQWFLEHPEKQLENEGYISGVISWAYNDFLQFFVDIGLVGTILFFSVFGVIIYYAFKTKIKYSAPFISAIVAIMVIASISYFLQTTTGIICLFLASTMLLGIVHSTIPILLKIRLNKIFVFSILLLLIILNLIFFNFQKDRFSNYKAWQDAQDLITSGNVKEAVKKYALLQNALEYNDQFMVQYSEVLYKNKEYNKCIEVLHEAEKLTNEQSISLLLAQCYENTGNYKKAEKNYLMAIAMVPSAFYPEYRLAMLYKKQNNIKKLRKRLIRIINKPVKVNSDNTQLIKKESEKLLHNLN